MRWHVESLINRPLTLTILLAIVLAGCSQQSQAATSPEPATQTALITETASPVSPSAPVSGMPDGSTVTSMPTLTSSPTARHRSTRAPVPARTPSPSALPCSAITTAEVTLYDSSGGLGDYQNLTAIFDLPADSWLLVVGKTDHDWYQVTASDKTPLGWIWGGDGGFYLREEGCGTFLNPNALPFSPVPNPHTCWYFPWGVGFFGDIFDSPNPRDSTLFANDTSQRYYRALTLSEVRIQIETERAVKGWMPYSGTLRGPCDDLPHISSRPEPPDGVCALFVDYPSEELFQNPLRSADSSLGPIPAGVWMPVTARVAAPALMERAYKVKLANDREGWIEGSFLAYRNSGTVTGPCDAVPVVNP